MPGAFGGGPVGGGPIGGGPHNVPPSTAPGPVIGRDMANIATLANGYLFPKHDPNGDGAIDIATESEGPTVRDDGKVIYSSIRDMAQAADQLSGAPDGKTTAQEFANFLSTFDTGDAMSPAHDGLLGVDEIAAWHRSGLVPHSSR